MDKQSHRWKKMPLADESSHEKTLSSLCEQNRLLRQQAVDLVLTISVMRERADRVPTANHELNQEPDSASVAETQFGNVVRSLRAAGAKS